MKYINNSNPKYFGLDKDPKIIFNARQKYNNHEFRIQDLNNTNSYFEIFELPNMQFDYLICMNSFAYSQESEETKLSWYNYVNKFSKTGSKLIINYLDINKIENIRYFGKSYIKNVCDKYFEFYFEWSNKEPIKEPKVDNLNLEGWFLIDEFIPKNDKLLCDLYIYRIYQKN